MLVALSGLVLAAGLVRNHEPAELALLGGLLLMAGLAGRLLARDLRAHPAGFPEPTPSHGLRMRGP